MASVVVVQRLDGIEQRAGRLVPRDVVGQARSALGAHERHPEGGARQQPVAQVPHRRGPRVLLGPVHLVEQVREGLDAGGAGRAVNLTLKQVFGHRHGPLAREGAGGLAHGALVVGTRAARGQGLGAHVALPLGPAAAAQQPPGQGDEVLVNGCVARGVEALGHLVEDRGDESRQQHAGDGANRLRRRGSVAGQKGGRHEAFDGRPGALRLTPTSSSVVRIRAGLGRGRSGSSPRIWARISRVPRAEAGG
jgi:hypothetical protein